VKKKSLKIKKNINVSFKPDELRAIDKKIEKNTSANLIINESTFEPSNVEDELNEISNHSKVYSLLTVKNDDSRWVIIDFLLV
jgi:hypothetical protein